MTQTTLAPKFSARYLAANSGGLAIAIMLMAVAALSLAAIFIRLSEQELGPFATIFNRFWVAFLVLWIWQGIRRFLDRRAAEADATAAEAENYTAVDFAWLGLAGASFWGCLALWACSLTQTAVANSTILHNLTPIFTTLGAWALLGQRFDRRFLLGLVVALCGAIALGLDDLQVSADNFTGDFLALLSAAFSAANLMVIERLRTKFSAATIILWCCLIGALLTLPVMLLQETQIFPMTLSGWLSVVGLALVCQILGQGLQAYSLKRLSSGIVGILLLLDPVLAALIAWFVFFEHLSLSNWLAFGVVLVGIYLAKSSRYAEDVMRTPESEQPPERPIASVSYGGASAR